MKKTAPKYKKIIYTALAVLFWIFVWYGVSMWYDMDFIIPTPQKTLAVLIENIQTAQFWSAILFSVCRISLGFLFSCIFGTVLALASIKIKPIKILFDPFCSAVRAVPVASFIILLLAMLPSTDSISTAVSFLMGFPIIYSTLIKGIDTSPEDLMEAADLFKLGFFKRLKYIYIPHLLPYMASALSVSVGLCFKSGVAAEVIGIPMGSVGYAMYISKIGFNMPELLSYTVVITLVSVICEKLILRFCKMPKRKGDTPK